MKLFRSAEFAHSQSLWPPQLRLFS